MKRSWYTTPGKPGVFLFKGEKNVQIQTQSRTTRQSYV